jgi:hypothetical protein
MRFEWRREGPAESCGANCRIWISAVGYITADTPREFEAFAGTPREHFLGAPPWSLLRGGFTRTPIRPGEELRGTHGGQRPH